MADFASFLSSDWLIESFHTLRHSQATATGSIADRKTLHEAEVSRQAAEGPRSGGLSDLLPVEACEGGCSLSRGAIVIRSKSETVRNF